MISQENVHLITIIIISLGLIFLGGSLFYQHNTLPVQYRNPILWSFAIALASGGGNVLIGLIFKVLLPSELSNQMKILKSERI